MTEVLGWGIPAIRYFELCQIFGGDTAGNLAGLSFLLQIQTSTSDNLYSQCVLLYLAERKGMIHFHLGTVISHHQVSFPGVSAHIPMACLLTSCTGGSENHIQRA